MTNKSTMSIVYGLRDMLEKYPCTQDIPELLRYDLHYLFVYGTLKYGHVRHALLEASGAKFQGIGTIQEKSFELFNTPYGFPVALFQTGNREAYGRLKGEIYAVSPQTIMNLDTIEGNGRMYYRDTFEVSVVRNNKIGRENLNCYTYLGTKRFWAGLMNVCTELPVRDGKEQGPYYYFSREDSPKAA